MNTKIDFISTNKDDDQSPVGLDLSLYYISGEKNPSVLIMAKKTHYDDQENVRFIRLKNKEVLMKKYPDLQSLINHFSQTFEWQEPNIPETFFYISSISNFGDLYKIPDVAPFCTVPEKNNLKPLSANLFKSKEEDKQKYYRYSLDNLSKKSFLEREPFGFNVEFFDVVDKFNVPKEILAVAFSYAENCIYEFRLSFDDFKPLSTDIKKFLMYVTAHSSDYLDYGCYCYSYFSSIKNNNNRFKLTKNAPTYKFNSEFP